MKVAFTVRADLARWGCDHGVFESGKRHEVQNASAALVGQVASAEAFGSLLDVEYDAAAKKIAAKAVEPDSASLRKLEQAMADGSWQEGNQLAYEAAKEADV